MNDTGSNMNLTSTVNSIVIKCSYLQYILILYYNLITTVSLNLINLDRMLCKQIYYKFKVLHLIHTYTFNV